MNNIRNICSRNLKCNNRKKTSLFKKKSVWCFSMLLMCMIIFWSMGITVNAKEEEQPLYKYYQSYMVEKDDTLFSIAYDLNADSCSDTQIQECVDEMISINSLDHKGTICYGNYILVPYYSTEYR